jgi:hypothetical protein
MYLSIDFGIKNFAYSIVNKCGYDVVDFKLLNIADYFNDGKNYLCEQYVFAVNSIMEEITQKYTLHTVIIENQMTSNSNCVML